MTFDSAQPITRSAAGTLGSSDLGAHVHVAGRVRAVRRMRRTTFFDIEDASGEIQCSGDSSAADIELLRSGQLAEVWGTLSTSSTGQLVVMATIAVESRPVADQKVLTQDFRSQRLERTRRSVRDDRALELMVDRSLRQRIHERSLLLTRLRQFLTASGFMEIDTPVLTVDRFAGTANAFAVSSKSLQRTLYMRGSMESHLKQLIVAGFEKIFTVGPSFRNESEALIEFLMLEGMWAYASQTQALGVIESLTQNLAESFAPETAHSDAREALKLPWQLTTFDEVVSEHLGFDIRGADSSVVGGMAAAMGLKIDDSVCSPNDAMDIVGYAILKDEIAGTMNEPTFVNLFPKSLSPLARPNEGDDSVADRGYMFFRGHRLCEVVQEEHEAEAQLANFRAQDDNMLHSSQSRVNDPLIDALRLGCPRTAGFGFHINRFVAAMTDHNRVSDVVPFPLTSARIAR